MRFLTKSDRKKISKALKLIQGICSETIFCENCPFGNAQGTCLIQDPKKTPFDWDIKNNYEEWRALQ